MTLGSRSLMVLLVAINVRAFSVPANADRSLVAWCECLEHYPDLYVIPVNLTEFVLVSPGPDWL